MSPSRGSLVSLRPLIHGAITAARRFPLSLLASAACAVLAVLGIEEILDEDATLRLLLTVVLGIPLFLAGHDQEGEGADFLFDQRLFPSPMGLVASGDPELASANLYVLQYQSDTFRERTQIEELAAGVAGALRSSRHDLPAAPQAKALDPHGAIVIIAHSLGGVVIRKALLSPQGRGTLAKTRLVYLASVPGSEVDKAFWGDRVDNQQLRELTEERLFTDIEAAWEPVARTGEGYRPRPGLRGADHL